MKPDQKKVQTKLKNNEESLSSEDDEDAELLTFELEKGFFEVLSRLKKKDAKLYEKSIRFFPVENLKSDTASLDQRQQQKQKKLEEDYKAWLKGQKEKIKDDELKTELEALHDFWVNPSLNEDDQFLRDYILNKKFLDPDENFNLEKELENLSEEEKEVEEQVAFEFKYNTRFEEPDQDFLKKYPHIMEKTPGKKNTPKLKRKLDEQRKAEVNGKLKDKEETKMLNAKKKRESLLETDRAELESKELKKYPHKIEKTPGKKNTPELKRKLDEQRKAEINGKLKDKEKTKISKAKKKRKSILGTTENFKKEELPDRAELEVKRTFSKEVGSSSPGKSSTKNKMFVKKSVPIKEKLKKKQQIKMLKAIINKSIAGGHSNSVNTPNNSFEKRRQKKRHRALRVFSPEVSKLEKNTIEVTPEKKRKQMELIIKSEKYINKLQDNGTLKTKDVQIKKKRKDKKSSPKSLKLEKNTIEVTPKKKRKHLKIIIKSEKSIKKRQDNGMLKTKDVQMKKKRIEKNPHQHL